MQGFVTTSTAQATEDALDAQVDWLLYEGLPFRTASSPKFLHFLELYRKGYGTVADRRQVPMRGHRRAQAVKREVVKYLQSLVAVSVAMDGWTNVRHNKVINLCPVAGGLAFYWDSVVLKGKARADDQLLPIKAGLQEILQQGICMVAMVTDNEGTNTALYHLLVHGTTKKEQFNFTGSFPFLLHIPCAAHTIQLCVKHAMKIDAVAQVVNAQLALLFAFKHNKDLRVKLKEQQKLLRPHQQELGLVGVCDTRWNSILDSAQRLLLLETCIKPFTSLIIQQLAKEPGRSRNASFTFDDATFWHPLKTVVDFLIPYQLATDMVQSDSSSLCDVHHNFSLLIEKANALAIPHPFAGIKEELLKIIRNQWTSHVSLHPIIICSLFSFDKLYARFDPMDQQKAMEWFFVWGVRFLSYYSLSSLDEAGIKLALKDQYAAFNSTTGLFANTATYYNLDQRHPQMLNWADRHQRHLDVLSTWRLQERTTPELAICALSLLSICPTEAAVERSFSRQGLVHSNLRNRSSDKSVQMQMLHSFNMRALEKLALKEEERLDRGSTEVLHTEDAEWGNGTALLSRYLDDEDIAAAGEEEQERESAPASPDAGKEEKLEEEQQDEVEKLEEEEEEEKEEEEEVSVEDAFISAYIADQRITARYKWVEHRTNALQNAIMQAGLLTTVNDMQKKIKARVGAEQAAVVDMYR